MTLLLALSGAFGCASRNDCGAVALASVMGPDADVQTLYQQTYTPGRGGALPTDMLGASRRHGYLPTMVRTWDELQRRLEEGHRVIVLQNRRVSWWPQWHYAVVAAYDEHHDAVRVEGQPDVKRDAFMNMWRDGRQWGVVLLPTPRRTTQTMTRPIDAAKKPMKPSTNVLIQMETGLSI